MRLIVGLGNPGPRHENSRHNIGFMVVDELARKLLPAGGNPWKMSRKLNSQLLITNSQLRQIILVKPQTMMNASGFAVKSLITNYPSFAKATEDEQLPITNLWVVHDDLDLPLGKIKIVKGHGSAGHHGIDSIVEQLGTSDFVRFRVGIGHPAGREEKEVGSGLPAEASAQAGKWEVGKGRLVSEKASRHDVLDYVLEEFRGKEAVEAGRIIKKTAKAVILAMEKGVEAAMNRYNSK